MPTPHGSDSTPWSLPLDGPRERAKQWRGIGRGNDFATPEYHKKVQREFRKLETENPAEHERFCNRVRQDREAVIAARRAVRAIVKAYGQACAPASRYSEANVASRPSAHIQA